MFKEKPSPMLSLARTNTTFIGRWWWTVDRWIVIAILLLISIGILLIMAASPTVADQHHWNSFYFIKKHLIFLIPTLIILVGVSLLSIENIKNFALIMLVICIGGLCLTWFAGIEIKGSCRWLMIGGLSLQISEFVKPSFSIVAAWLFSKQHLEPSFPGNIISIFLYLLIIGLLLIQPDLGMVIVITAMWFSQFFLAGLPLFWVFSASGIGLTGIIGAYFLFSHVKRRVDHFLFPDTGDKFGDRYQITQSLDAFMNGGLVGKGPGEGTVKKYLPDAHADFIFAVAGEEFGLILCFCLVVLFAFIILRCLTHLFKEKNLFILLAVAGRITQFGLQTIINMASTLNLMPTK